MIQKENEMNWQSKLRKCILYRMKKGGANMHSNADHSSAKLLMGLISSANDYCVVFGTRDLEKMRLTLKVKETASVALAPRVSENVTQPRPRPHAADHVSSCPPIAGFNLLATASPLENTWHAHSERSTDEGNLFL